MRRPLHYDRAGEPIGMEEWCRLLGDMEYRRVEHTELPGLDRYVSTIWLGLDHSIGEGPPLIFESMDFPEQAHCCRYATEAEARAGHLELVAQLSTAH